MWKKFALWISIANHLQLCCEAAFAKPTNVPFLQSRKSCSFNQCIFTTNFPCTQASLFFFFSSNRSWLSIGFKAISRSQSYRAQNFVHHFTTNMFSVGRQTTDIDLDEFCRWAIFSRWPLQGHLIDICSYYLYWSEKGWLFFILYISTVHQSVT